MASVIATLTLSVEYFYEDGSEPDEGTCKDQLISLVELAANRGLLSGDSDLCVNHYDYSVEAKRGEAT